MKKKKLAVIISLATIFGLTSCKEKNNNNNQPTITTTEEDKEYKTYSKMAYDNMNLEMDYETFASKLTITEDGHYKYYSVNEDNMLYQFCFYKNFEGVTQMYSYIKSVGSKKHLLFYKYKDSSFVNVGELDIQNDKVSITYDEINGASRDYTFEGTLFNTLLDNWTKTLFNELFEFSYGVEAYLNQAHEYTYDSTYTLNILYKEDNKDKIKVDYKFNGSLPLEFTEYKKDINNDWQIRQKQEFTYDNEGKKIGENHYEVINHELTKVYESHLENDILTKKTLKADNYQDGAYNSLYEEVYEDERIIVVTKYDYKDGTWAINFKKEYTYYDNGKKKESLESFIINDQLTPCNKNEYEYYDDGKLKTNTFSSNNNGVLEYFLKNEYKYEENGLKVIDECFIYNGHDWTYQQKTETTYNENEKPVSIIEALGDDDSWVYGIKKDFTYDEDGKMTSRMESDFIDNDWFPMRKFITVSDELEYKEFEVTKPIYDTLYHKIEYTYNDSYEVLTETESIYKDNKWVEIEKGQMVNDKYYPIFDIAQTSGYFYNKKEYTYDNLWRTTSEILSNYSNGDFTLLGMWEYSYDGLGEENYTKIYSTYKNGSWVPCSKGTHSLENKKETIIYSLPSDNGWVFNSKEEYEYDENDKCVSSTKFDFIKNDWFAVRKLIPKDGQPILLEYKVIINKNDDLYHKLEYTYNDSYEVVEEKEYMYIDSTWILIEVKRHVNGKVLYLNEAIYDDETRLMSKYIHTFDDNGNITSKTTAILINKEWLSIEKVEMTYDSKGNVLSEIYSKYQNTECIYVKKIEYTYNDLGSVLTYTKSNYVNNNPILSENYVNTYDDNNNLVSRINYAYVKDKWVENGSGKTINGKYCQEYGIVFNNGEYYLKFVYDYDDKGNLTLETRQQYKDGSWVNVSQHVCKYDNGNKVTLRTDYVFENGGWNLSSKIEFSYDKGLLTTEIKSNYQNGSWVYSQKTDYIYTSASKYYCEYSYYSNGSWVKQ